MKTQLLSDNWTLQNAGEFIHGGLQGRDFQDLFVPEGEDSFHYVKGDVDLVRFDALCQLLTNLVLSDQVWVDAHYSSVWEKYPSVGVAKSSGVVVGKQFRDFERKWIGAREVMARELCVNRALLKAHRKTKGIGQSMDLLPTTTCPNWCGAVEVCSHAPAFSICPTLPTPNGSVCFAEPGSCRARTPWGGSGSSS